MPLTVRPEGRRPRAGKVATCAMAVAVMFPAAPAPRAAAREGAGRWGASAVPAPTDAEVATAIEDELRHDKTVPARLVGVRVRKGVVLLAGSVPTLLARARALARVRLVKGVRAVVDLLVVNPPRRADGAIRGDVERALDAAGAREVAPGVRAGLVTLTGVAGSWIERDLAVVATAGVRGVRAIEDRVSVERRPERGDAEIAEDVEGRIEDDAWLSGRAIQVRVEEGTVELRGVVRSRVEAIHARSAAAGAGAARVEDGDLVEALPARTHREPTDFPMRPDEEIAAAARDALSLDPRLGSAGPLIETSADSGLVTLEGVVEDLAGRRAALEDAANVRGALGVRDRLAVRPPAKARPDGRLLARLRAALRAEPVLAASGVMVGVHGATVFLSGEVETRTERALAAEVAAGIAGVAAVQNHVSVRSDPTTHRPDWRIERTIRERLLAGAAGDARGVRLAVRAGVVTLTGTVADEAQRRAVILAAREAGARSVRDGLRVSAR